MLCCLVVPDYFSHAAYLYKEDEVFACSTGTGRISLPQETIVFGVQGNTQGEKINQSHLVDTL